MSAASLPYRDPSRPVDERVADLLDRMTLDEKIAQLRAIWLKPQPGGRYEVWDRMVEQGTDPARLLADGIGQITRPFGTVPIEPADGWRSLRAVQRFLRENTRLGIPALPHDECLSGFMAQGATQFPSPLSMGATWNPDLIEQVAGVISRQMREAGSLQGVIHHSLPTPFPALLLHLFPLTSVFDFSFSALRPSPFPLLLRNKQALCCHCPAD